MRKLILTFVLGTLSLCAFSQEAFYIYRNDGDFNGFFYDEVIEMRQSKLGVDSIEYDKWVTQEVVLEDTIYRIPLAAIDSIGFQQPEIKFNPRVKFMEKDGYCPYFYSIGGSMNSSLSVYFRNLPANMIPQVGDVLIGLQTDPIATEEYDYMGGSFAMKIESVSIYDNEDYEGPFTACALHGSPVENLADVFEQYITVEQIGVDQQGNMIRRVAGCEPDGMPRKVKNVADHVDVSLIDFESTFTRTWNPTENSSIDLAANLGIKLKFRIAYNITWSRFMTSMTQEFTTKIKPSLTMATSVGGWNFEYTTDDLVPLGEVLFPASFPMFAIRPIPQLFLRGQGQLEAKLNLPAVELGIGQHFVVDTDSPFPISSTLYLPESDKTKELDADFLDLSAEVAFNGFIQTGIKFSGDIFTASWLKKIMRFAIGTYLYVGPKIGGHVQLGQATLDGGSVSMYGTLSGSYVNVALPSLDLEAKATISVFSREEKEKKFFDKNWSFFADTAYFAPLFSRSTVTLEGNNLHVSLPSKKHACVGYHRISVSLLQDYADGEQYICETPEQTYYRHLNTYEFDITTNDLKSTEYDIYPVVKSGTLDAAHVYNGAEILIPPTLELNTDTLMFGGTTNLTQTMEVTSNVVDEDKLWASFQGSGISVTKEVIDATTGKYRLTFKATPNSYLFDTKTSGTVTARCEVQKGGQELLKKAEHIGVYQAANNLEGFTFSLSLSPGEGTNVYGVHYYSSSPVTATRVGNNRIHVTGTYTETIGSRTETNTVDLYLNRLGESQDYSAEGTASSIVRHEYSSGKSETYTSVATIVATQDSRGIVTELTSDYEERNRDGEVIQTEHSSRTNFPLGSDIWVRVKLPNEQ